MKCDTTIRFLRDIADIQTGPFGSQLHKEDYVEYGTPIVTVEHLGNRKFTEQNLPKVSDSDKERLKKYVLATGDIVFSRVGSVDRCSYVDEEHNGWMFSGRCLRVRPSENIDSLYLYYYFCREETRQLVRNIAVGATMPSINTKLLGEVPVAVPDLQIQKMVSNILSTIDNKIELNNKINANLQQQAQAIFKSWFVDFEPFQDGEFVESELGTIPVEFTITRTGRLPLIVTDYIANGSFASLKANVHLYQERNYAYFIRNTDLKSGGFKVFVDEHSYNFLSKSRLQGGEIIISNVGDVGSVFLCPVLDAPMTLGNNMIMLKPECQELQYYLYIWFKYSLGQNLIQGIKSGSAQPKFNKTDFKSLPIVLPPDKILQEFHEVVSPIFKLVEKNQLENRKIAMLRDVLLPKLMNGEIDIIKD